MELQQMRYVVAVADEGNFTRAADRCLVVQSALSHQIKSLERELGVALFARTSRKVEITSAGQAFVAQARASLEAAERAVFEAAAASGQVRGTLTIGVIPTVTAIDIPASLGIFHRVYPNVKISLRDGGSDEFVRSIKAGTMDVAVLGLPDNSPPQGVNARILTRESLVAVVGTGHRLAERRKIGLQDLAGEVFVDFPQGTPGRLPSDFAFQAAGVRREVTFEAMNIEMILGLVKQGLVIALLSPSLIPSGAENLRTIMVEAGPSRIEYLAWSSFNPAPAAQAFLDSLR